MTQDVEDGERLVNSRPSSTSESLSITHSNIWVEALCASLSLLVRGSFAVVVLGFALVLILVAVQAAWKVLQMGSSILSGAPDVSTNTTSVLLVSQHLSRFQSCASDVLNGDFKFARNACWNHRSGSGELESFVLALSAPLLRDHAPKRLFLVEALYDQGASMEGKQQIIAHMPARETDYNVFRLDQSPSGELYDLSTQETGFRSVNSEFERDNIQASLGVSRWLTSLAIVKDLSTPDTVWLDVTEFVENLFYVASKPFRASRSGKLDHLRIRACRVTKNTIMVVVQVSTLDPAHGSSLVETITFSLVLLPEHSARSREMHEDIGYFTTSFELLGAPQTSMSVRENRVMRIINRRVSNFVFLLDHSIPQRYLQAVKEGVLAWNVAFREIGSPIRLKALLPTDDDFPSDYMIGDVEFSTISWSISQHRVFALGPSTVDPRSGEILSSNIVIADSWPVSWFDDLDAFLPPDKLLATCMNQHTIRSHQLLWSLHSANQTLFQELFQMGIRSIVMHEVGHALGKHISRNSDGSTDDKHRIETQFQGEHRYSVRKAKRCSVRCQSRNHGFCHGLYAAEL